MFTHKFHKLSEIRLIDGHQETPCIFYYVFNLLLGKRQFKSTKSAVRAFHTFRDKLFLPASTFSTPINTYLHIFIKSRTANRPAQPAFTWFLRTNAMRFFNGQTIDAERKARSLPRAWQRIQVDVAKQSHDRSIFSTLNDVASGGRGPCARLFGIVCAHSHALDGKWEIA